MSTLQIGVSTSVILTLSFYLLGCQPCQAGDTSNAQTGRGPDTDSGKALPKVLLVGDSITGYYFPVVQRELTNVAEVKRLFRKTSQNVFEELDEVIAAKPDILHLNCGLWDLIVSTNTGKAQVSLDEYKTNLEKIFRRLHQESHAKLIWSTTTPVKEQQQLNARPHGYGRIVRREAEVKLYNQASLKIAKRLGLQCDDVFGVVTSAGPVEYLDGVHFKEAGNELLGKHVADVIRPILSKQRSVPN